MTGADVVRLRQELGMSVTLFAELLGVHRASVYRWERAGGELLVLDPLPERLLLRLQQTVEQRPTNGARRAWRDGLRKAVLTGGTLQGLALLLDGLAPSALSDSGSKEVA